MYIYVYTYIYICVCLYMYIGVSCFAQFSPGLIHLNISKLSITDAAMSIIVTICIKLKHLWADNCDLLTDSAVVEISYGLPHLLTLHLSSDKKLYYDSYGEEIYHKQYTDDAFEALLDGARNLQGLSFKNQNNIRFNSPWFLNNFPKRAGHFSLQKIDLSGVDFINIENAAIIFKNCTNLNDLKVSKKLKEIQTQKYFDMVFFKSVYSMSYLEANKDERLFESKTMNNSDTLGIRSTSLSSLELTDISLNSTSSLPPSPFQSKGPSKPLKRASLSPKSLHSSPTRPPKPLISSLISPLKAISSPSSSPSNLSMNFEIEGIYMD
jgi:hypothetical protein